jgi:HEPN domain-containing protein
VNRYDLQKLALVRLKDASALFRSGRFEGAYYLSGYVIECAFKACIAKSTRRYDFPDKAPVQAAHTHDLKQLLSRAKLDTALRVEFERNAEFRLNWLVVQHWSVDSRYQTNGQQQAKELLEAVNDRRHGVLKWIRQHW